MLFHKLYYSTALAKKYQKKYRRFDLLNPCSTFTIVVRPFHYDSLKCNSYGNLDLLCKSSKQSSLIQKKQLIFSHVQQLQLDQSIDYLIHCEFRPQLEICCRQCDRGTVKRIEHGFPVSTSGATSVSHLRSHKVGHVERIL